jgi:hypothetical protein
MTNCDLAELCGTTRNNVHAWKRVFSKAGMIGSEVARANSTADSLWK